MRRKLGWQKKKDWQILMSGSDKIMKKIRKFFNSRKC
jgi:NAD(P)H-flavin reductase